jgi:hypothetical protein
LAFLSEIACGIQNSIGKFEFATDSNMPLISLQCQIKEAQEKADAALENKKNANAEKKQSA